MRPLKIELGESVSVVKRECTEIFFTYTTLRNIRNLLLHSFTNPMESEFFLDK